jgi:tetratricopeptide (TPR) repeat protein
MFLSFILNIYDDMKHYAEKFFEVRKSSWLLISAYVGHEFFGGLVSFRIYRETGDSSWLDRGKKCQSTIQLWAEQGSLWNFAHKNFLMKAEEHYCEKNFSCAQTAYDNALVCARAHKFINDEALAYELAGYFYLSAGKTAEAIDHLLCAHEKYTEWGAWSKVNMIFQFIHEKFGSVPDLSRLSNAELFGRTAARLADGSQPPQECLKRNVTIPIESKPISLAFP